MSVGSIVARLLGRSGGGEQTALLTFAMASFMVGLNARVVVTLLPNIASDLGTTVGAAGIIVTAYTVPYGVLQLVYGTFIDRVGRLRLAVVCMCVVSCGSLLSGLAPNLTVVAAARLMAGAAASAMFPISASYIGEAFAYEKRQGALGTLLTAGATANILSGAIGGVIATFLSWRAVFELYGLLALCVAFALTRQRELGAAASARMPVGQGYREVWRNPETKWVMLAMLFEGLLITGPFSYMGGYLAARFQFSAGNVGLLLAIYGVTTLVMGRGLGRLSRHFSETQMMLAGSLLVATSWLLVAFEPVAWLFPLAMIVAAAGYVSCHTTLQARTTELAPNARGIALGLHGVFLWSGVGSGAALEGQLILRSGFEPLFALCSGGVVLYGIALWLTLGRRPWLAAIRYAEMELATTGAAPARAGRP